ncbi:microtubule-associated protein futsch isoform X7 [Diachasma alloeum]|uniref:microtubule-associated protein futsch isoform X7 n=1 Tax=Diachasma alloeum TaxID=454923 RepID=UPI0007384709|nr:microtubule-associated protein futsch isoform X7 [Diachasma alloeum]
MAKDKAVKTRKKSKKMACCGCTRNRNSDVFCEDPMLSDQQQYRYMTVDDMKSMGDDSMRVNVTDDEKDNRHSGGVSVTDMVTKETYQRTNAANLKPDNVDIHRHPVHVGLSLEFLNSSLAALGSHSKGQGMWRDSFLVSFLVDARGGAMRGCRHSGVRVIVPPRKAAMPMRVTCRYLKRDKLTNPPPLMEGEALASRILELGPVGAKFLGPVIIEVPHFASLRGKEREIVILRSDNGETWREHTLEASEEAVQDVLNESFEGEELSQLEDLQTSRIVRILTVDFPHYFAVVSRIRQEVHAVGPEGGTVSSSAVPQVQAVFPPAALTKKIRVGLQAHPIPVELVAKLLGNRVAVSPIVTVEPRRRKFHKPITLTIPVPQAANKGMINQYSGETPTLRLLCSITGGQSRAVWEDVTGSTPLQFVKDCVSFTTTVSARFWLMDCRNVTEATRMATELYTHATHVPFMAKFVVFAKRVDPLEARLRVFCMTDDKEDKTLEHQEHFTEVAKSRDVEVLEGKTQYMEFAGNLVPVLKSGEQLQLPFRAFKENRVPFTARVKDPDAADMVGRIMFMSEPKVAKGEPPQTPICTLNILLPEKISPDAAHSELDLLELSKNYSFLRDGGMSRPDTIHRATIRLTDIANLLDRDWEKLAEEMNISPGDVELIKLEHPDKPALQAATMFKIWQANGNKATGNTLEKALNKIGREDIVKKCIFNVELVTDDVEKAVARVRLDQPGFDSLKEELGPSRDSSLRRDGTLSDRKTDLDYEEPDRMRDSESIEDLKAVGNVPHKQTKQQHITINGTTVFNGTSTPIKDKYASDEKELVDEMADFIEHKCHKTDTMTKRIRDEADDDNKNRQKIIEDANRLVTGVLQDAEKEKEKLAKEGWSGVYDDASKEAEGAVGQIEGIIAKESVGRGEESIEPLIIKKKKIDTPHGTIITTITTTTKGAPKSGTVISETKTIKETITPGQVHLFETKEPVTLSQDSSKKKVTITKTTIMLDSGLKDAEISKRSDEPSAPMAAFDPNVEADRSMEPAQDIVRIQPDPALMSAKDRTVSESEKLLKGGKEIAEKTMKNKLNDDAKDLKTVKPTKEMDTGAYEGVYNVHLDDSKAEEGKKKEKGSIFSGIFKGPKIKKGKKRDSKEVSFDSGDEDIKVTKEFLEDTRKVADLTRDSPQFEYPAFDPTTYICICPQKLPEQEPNRDPIWATADFLYDSRRSAEAFVPEIEDLAEEQEIKPIDGVAITPEVEKTPKKKLVTKEEPVSADDHKEKHGFFSGLFKGSKKHDGDVETPIMKTKKEDKNIIAKHEQEMQKSVAELKSSVDDEKDRLDSSVKTTVDDVDSVITTTKKSVLDDIKDFKKAMRNDKKQADDGLKRLSGDLKSLDEKIKSGADEIEKETKHATGVLKTEVEETTDEVKDKSSGFFGIFKSPKTKNRRSRSKDKDTSKDVSFDSGDEELRISTAAFLDDTRKAADRALLKLEKEPQVKEQSDIKVEKFITTVPEESDLPKDKLKGSSYDVKVPKVETTTITKTIISNSDPNDAVQSSEQKRSRVDKKKAEQRRSGEFSDSADESKSKGTSFFEKFKSPKLRSRKNRSRDRSTSTEPSFDSGDEELRHATSKFLDDTRKIAEATGSFDEPRKSLKDTLVTKEPVSPVTAEVKQTDDEAVDVKSKEDDGKGKSGLFGIFKSPKSHIRRRSKSREKSSSTDASFDSGDEDLRIATSKLLDDTRKIADIMEEHPYPSAPAVQLLQRDEGDGEKPTELGEKSGFLSGIFKSAKHAVEEVTDDVKEFWEETKEEAEEEKQQADHELEKTTKAAAEIGDGITAVGETVNAEIDKKVGETLNDNSETLQTIKVEITDVPDKTDHNIPHRGAKGSTEVKEKASKVSKDIDKAKKSMAKPPKKEVEAKKGKVAVDTKKVSDSPTAAKRKTGREPEKLKEKGPGLLSGIIKGAKHAVDEVSEDVKEFWDETQDEAKKEDERAQKEDGSDVRKSPPIKDSDSSADETGKKEKLVGKDVTGSLKGIKGKVIQTTTTTVKTTRVSPPKNGKTIDQTKKAAPQPSKEESKTVKRKISDVDKTVAAKAKTAKETAAEKVKVTKNVPEDPKTTKDTTVETAKSANQPSAEQAKLSKGSPTEKLKSDKNNGQEKTKSMRQSPPKAAGDVDQPKRAISKQVKTESKTTKGKVDAASKSTAGAKDAALKKDKDVKKGKDKGSDFLTGIIKGAKHAADEVTEDVNQFLDETRKDAEEQEKQLRREAEETAKTSEDMKNRIGQDIESAKDDASHKVTEKSKDIVDLTHAADKEATQMIDGIGDEFEKDTKVIQDHVTETATVAIDSTEKAADKVEKEAKKAKDKGKGFLFGIFKGSKHSVDEMTDGIQDTIDDVKKEAEKGKEAMQGTVKYVKEKLDHDVNIVKTDIKKSKNSFDKEIKEGKIHIDDKISGTATAIKDDIDTAACQGQKELEQAKKTIEGALSEISEKSDNGISKAHIGAATITDAVEKTPQIVEDTAKQVVDNVVNTRDATVKEIDKNLNVANEKVSTTAEEISDLIKDGKDKAEKEARKAKDKGKGFFTNIFKGSKHAVETTGDDVQNFLEKAKEEAARDKEQLQQNADKIAENITDIKGDIINDLDSGKDAIVDMGKAADDALSSTTKQASNATKDATKKVADEILDTKHAVAEGVQKNAERLKEDVKEVAHSVSKAADESQDKIGKEAIKAKEKTKGFFSGIFKGVKHASDEVAEDAKDLADEAGRELEEDQHKISKYVSDTTKTISDVADEAKNKTIDTTAAGKDAVVDAGQTVVDTVSGTTYRPAKATEDAVKKMVDGMAETKDSISAAFTKDSKNLKDQMQRTTDKVVNTAEERKDKIEKEAGKAKDKTKGFFTGIFKGGKHAADEVIKDTNDFIQETEKAIEEDRKLSAHVAETKTAVTEGAEKAQDKLVSAAIASKDASTETANATGNAVASTVEGTSRAVDDTVKTVSEKIAESKAAITEKGKKETERLKEDVKNVTHSIADTTDEITDKIEKDAAKAKEKTKGFFSGIFKGAKYAADEVAQDTKDFMHDAGKEVQKDEQMLSKKVSEIKVHSTDAAEKAKDQVIDTAIAGKDTVTDTVQVTGDVISSTTEKASQATNDTVKKMADDVTDTKVALTESVKKGVESLEDGAKDVAHAAADTAEGSKHKAEKEVAKAKGKSKGFFSGIFKGAKHAADEVVDDVKEFIHETEQEAKKDEEKLSKNISDTAANVKDVAGKVKDKVVDTAIAGKDAVVDGAKTVGEEVSNTAGKAKDQLVDSAVAGKDAVVDGAKATGEAVSSTVGEVQDKFVDTAVAGKDAVVRAKTIGDAVSSSAEQASKASKDTAKKISDDIIETKDAVTQKVTENVESVQDEMKDVGRAVVESVKEAEEKVEKEATKAKDKTKGFFSGIFKGAKHAAEEVAEDTKNVVKETEDKLKQDKEKLPERVSEIKQSVTETIGKAKNEITDSTLTSKEIAADVAKAVGDTVLSAADQTSKIREETAKKITTDVVQTSDFVTTNLQTNVEGLKGELKDVAHMVADTAEESRGKMEKEASKTKEKSKGFFSGIFKGGKHAVGEISQDTKDFLDHTKKEIEQDREKLSKQASDTTTVTDAIGKVKDEVIDKAVSGKDAVVHAASTTGDVLSSSAEHALKTTQDTSKKIFDGVVDAKVAVSKHVKTDMENLKDGAHTVAETVEENADKVEKEALKTKEKTKGFFSGIFKGAKHAADEAAEDTKDFLDHAKKEIQQDGEKLSKQVSDTTTTFTETAEKAADKLVETSVAGKEAIIDVAKTSADVLSSSAERALKTSDDAAKEVVDDAIDVKEAISKKVKTGTEHLKEGVQDVAHVVADAAAETKDEAEKEVTKAKEKAKGFFSGIFKGSKHATDEVVDDVKELAQETKNEVKKDKEIISKHISDTTSNITNTVGNVQDKIVDTAVAGKHAIADAAKTTGDVLASTTKQAAKATKDTVEKIDANMAERKQAITDEVKKETESLKDGVEHVTHAVADSAKKINDKAEKEAMEAKDKTKGFFSGIFKGAKHAADEVVDDVKEFIHETEEDAKHEEKLSKHISETTDNVTDAVETAKNKVVDTVVASKQSIANAAEATGVAISSTTEQASTATRDTVRGISGDITKTNQAITDKVKEKTESLSDGVKHVAHTVVDSAKETKEKAEKEAAKAKDKTEGFFSGIFKGARHAADEVVDDVKEFIHVTEEEAKHEEEKLSKKISDTTGAISDTAQEIKGQVVDTAVSSKHAVVDVAKGTGDTVLSTAGQASKATKDTVKKIVDNVTEKENALAEKLKKHTESVKDEAEHVASTVAESAQENKDMIEKEAAKAKEKTHGFFSEIFKGAQHATDEAAQETKKLIDETGKKIGETERKAAEKISDTTTTVTDAAVKAKDHIVDTAVAGKDAVVDSAKSTGEVLSKSADHISKTTSQAAKKVGDGVTDTKEAISEELEKDAKSIKDAVRDTAHALGQTAEKTQDKAEKEVTKAKDKTRGFFSGIFKGAKHAADEVVDDVKEFIHETEEEAQEEEEKARKLTAETMKDTKKAIDESTTKVSEGLGNVLDKSEKLKDDAHQKVKNIEKSASDAMKVAGDTFTDAASNALHVTKKSGRKISAELSHAKDTVRKDDAHIVEEKIAETTDNAAAAKEKLEKKAKKTKEKTKGLFSGIFKGAKHSSEEGIDNMSEFLEETNRELEKEAEKTHRASEEATKSIEKAVSDLSATNDEITQKISQAATDVSDTAKGIVAERQKNMATSQNAIMEATVAAGEALSDIPIKIQGASSETVEKIGKEVDATKKYMSDGLDRGIHLIEEKGTKTAGTVAESANAMKTATEEEVVHAKEKGKGFFSGILKSAKHAVDEVAADIDEFKTKTQKEAEEEEEAARQALNNAAKSVKSVKHKIETDSHAAKKKVDEQASKVVQRAENALVTAETDLDRKLDSVDQKTAKTGESISETASKSIQNLRDTSKKVDDKAHEVKDVFDKELKEDSKIVKQAVSDFTHSIADSAEVAELKLEAETQKTKEKTKGFFSGIFKSGKQAADDTAHETQEFIDKSKKEFEEEKQAAVKSVIDAYDKAAMDVQSGDQTAQKISQTSHDISNVAERIAEDISDGSRKIQDKIYRNVEDLKDKTHKVHDKLAEDTSKVSGQIINNLYDTKEAVVAEADKNIAAAKINIDGAVQSTTDPTDTAQQEIGKTTKMMKDKGEGFFSGIVKGAKHALEEVTDDVKEFWDETKEEAKEEEEHVKHKIIEADKSVKHELDTFGQDIQMITDGRLDFKDLETDLPKQEKEGQSKTEKQKGKSGPIFGILRRDKHDKIVHDEVTTVGQVIIDGTDAISSSTKSAMEKTTKDVKDDVKAVEEKIIDRSKAVADSAEVVKDQIEKDVKKTKEKSSNFFSGIIKGAKHAVEDVSDDVKEFWDESKQSAKEDGKQIQEDVKKTGKQVEGKKDEASTDFMKREGELRKGMSVGYEPILQTIDDNSLSSQPLAQSTPPIQDPYVATVAFLEDSRETAMQIDDRMPIAPTEMESSREEKSSKGKSKSVISSMVKATEKFWEDTKPEFAHVSGSYDVSSPQRKTDKKSDIVDDAQVTLESFGPIESRLRETSTVTKSVSGIPQKIDAAKDFDTEVRVVRTEKSLERELDDSNRVKGVGHLEPHARQTVTTIVTKSSMRTTMSTPPPSPDELGDSRIKDVTEEAAKRAQSLADQALELETSGHDSAEIDGTVERHVTSAPTNQSVPDPRHCTKSSSLKKELCLDLEVDKHHPKSQSPRSKIPQASSSSPKPLASVPLDISLEESSQKSKIPIKTKEGKRKDKNNGVVTISKTEDGDTTIISRHSFITKTMEDDSGETSVITRTVTSIVSESSGSLSQADMNKLIESSNFTDPAASITETTTRTVITDRIPKSTSKEDNGACTSAKEIVRSISTKSSWESSSRSHDKDNWDQIQCSLDTSPGSGDIAFTKNGDSRHELPSDSDSDGSPRARRRSLSKRRTLGSSSGSDVALHEGAELSPLEDDQESDFMQQSEPSYVETTTTEIDPVTNERITKTTRVATSSGTTGGGAGSDELRESMQKIVDQFMTEERRGQ